MKGSFGLNVYDFDNTIYDGESVFDFFLFCMKKKPWLIKYIPMMIFWLIKYKLCLVTSRSLIKKAEKYMHKFFLRVNDTDELIKEFWDKNMHKIKPFYIKNHSADDVVISASWDLLIKEICTRLGIKNYIASEVDKDSFKIKFLCFRDNKVRVFNEKYKDKTIDNFYTDSKNDLPMMKIAKNSYIVKGNSITKVK